MASEPYQGGISTTPLSTALMPGPFSPPAKAPKSRNASSSLKVPEG